MASKWHVAQIKWHVNRKQGLSTKEQDWTTCAVKKKQLGVNFLVKHFDSETDRVIPACDGYKRQNGIFSTTPEQFLRKHQGAGSLW